MEVKKERLQRLNALVNEMSAEAMKKHKGQIVEVLVEGKARIILKYLQDTRLKASLLILLHLNQRLVKLLR